MSLMQSVADVEPLQKYPPKIVKCHLQRCGACPFSTKTGDCREIVSSQKEGMPVVLIEPGRGFLHFQTKHSGGAPPWRTSEPQREKDDHIQRDPTGNEWESVYIEEEARGDLDKLVLVYPVGPYVSLFMRSEDGRTAHKAVPRVKSPLEMEIIDRLAKEFSVRSVSEFSSFNNLVEKWHREVLAQISDELPEIDLQTRSRVARVVAHSLTALGPLFPLFMDELVEDIFLDRPGSVVYFDHRFLGRCSTLIAIGQDVAKRIITLLRAESNFHLDRGNPSLKSEVFVERGLLRFSVTIPPLSHDGLHLEIRRSRTKPFTLYELIENGTITIDAAALLVLAINARMNITIAGEPGTGKTTLLNALDFCTPRSWRKIYVEDTIESRIQNEHHQIRYRVDPVDETRGRLSKIDEVTKALHRSPDYLILGEIQEANHSKALFQALMSGLRSMQTCHSSSAAALISRWKFGHGIPEHAIALMDLVIVLDRPQPGKSRRVVKQIAEIQRESEDGFLRLKGINTIYSRSRLSESCDLSQDGALLQRSQEFGVGDPGHCLQDVAMLIRQSLSPDVETHWKIGELLWANGNPFKLSLPHMVAKSLR